MFRCLGFRDLGVINRVLAISFSQNSLSFRASGLSVIFPFGLTGKDCSRYSCGHLILPRCFARVLGRSTDPHKPPLRLPPAEVLGHGAFCKTLSSAR